MGEIQEWARFMDFERQRIISNDKYLYMIIFSLTFFKSKRHHNTYYYIIIIWTKSLKIVSISSRIQIKKKRTLLLISSTDLWVCSWIPITIFWNEVHKLYCFISCGRICVRECMNFCWFQWNLYAHIFNSSF